MSHSDLSRRAFLAATTTTAAAFAGATPGTLRDGERFNTAQVVPGEKSPNEALNIAGIGVGGKGLQDIMSVARRNNVVALCDVDWDRAAEAFYKIDQLGGEKKAKHYKDYRNMLDEMPEIDAVTISTPDHHHAVAAYRAMKLGKHVYVQKPLTHTIAEARLLAKTAIETKVATQMGNQGHSNDGARELCEMMWSGAIGPVREAHIWTSRPHWPQGITPPALRSVAPETLDWDRWLGPAAARPYLGMNDATGKPTYCPFVWRGWWDFGCGAIGDMACHIMDPAFWALKLGEAATFSVEPVMQEGHNDFTAPTKSIIKYSFPARGDIPPVDVYWYDGGNKPPQPAGVPEGTKLGDDENGSYYVGDSGILTSGEYGGNSRLLPDDKMAGYTKPAETIPRIKGQSHYRDWLDACKGGTPACSNFSYAGPLTEVANLANIALRAGKKIEWDSAAMRVTNDESANQYVTKEYRKGWELPC